MIGRSQEDAAQPDTIANYRKRNDLTPNVRQEFVTASPAGLENKSLVSSLALHGQAVCRASAQGAPTEYPQDSSSGDNGRNVFSFFAASLNFSGTCPYSQGPFVAQGLAPLSRRDRRLFVRTC